MKIFSNLKRFIDYIENETGLYSYWVLASIVIFIFLGILPLSKKLFAQYTTFTQMKEYETALSNKEKELKEAASTLREINMYIPYLNLLMPQGFNVSDYMVQMSMAGSNNGFSLDSFSPNASKEGIKSFTLKFEGGGDLLNLVKEIESLTRITQVNSVSQNLKKGEYITSVEVTTYSIPK